MKEHAKTTRGKLRGAKQDDEEMLPVKDSNLKESQSVDKIKKKDLSDSSDDSDEDKKKKKKRDEASSGSSLESERSFFLILSTD
jgi:hypothetical protein